MSSLHSCDLAPSTVAYFPIAILVFCVSLFFSPSIILFPFYHPPPLSSCLHHPSLLLSPPIPSSFYIIHHPSLLLSPPIPSSSSTSIILPFHHPPLLLSSSSSIIILYFYHPPIHHLSPLLSSSSPSIISLLFHHLPPLCYPQMPLSSRRRLVK